MPADETVKRPMQSPVARTRERAARLCIVFPARLVGSLDVSERSLVMGRQPGGPADLALIDATVSRRHAEIAWSATDAVHTIRDLGSSNGSRVRGGQLGPEPITLCDGDVIRVGDVIMVYETGGAVPETPGLSRDAIPGDAAATSRLRAAVAAAAADPSPVLLIGETGTGKEFIAREIHRLSGRAGRLVAVNCAALSPQLIESQLFGHRRGAFTGADRDEPGLFRAAEGGTILLDEVGELPLELQAKLLRVLQEGEVLPVGATRALAVDARVVAATLRDLRALAERGAFRLDLYARLSPWEIRVPPLTARRTDLLGWIERIHRQWHTRRELTPPAARFEANAVERLLLHAWPDNLRGVDRLVHHVCSDPSQPVYDLPPDWQAPDRVDPPASRPPVSVSDHRRERRSRPTREELLQALADSGGSVRATAKALGRERRLIYRWMELYGIRDK